MNKDLETQILLQYSSALFEHDWKAYLKPTRIHCADFKRIDVEADRKADRFIERLEDRSKSSITHVCKYYIMPTARPRMKVRFANGTIKRYVWVSNQWKQYDSRVKQSRWEDSCLHMHQH